MTHSDVFSAFSVAHEGRYREGLLFNYGRQEDGQRAEGYVAAEKHRLIIP